MGTLAAAPAPVAAAGRRRLHYAIDVAGERLHQPIDRQRSPPAARELVIVLAVEGRGGARRIRRKPLKSPDSEKEMQGNANIPDAVCDARTTFKAAVVRT